MSTASLIALSAQATFCAPCICSANSCIRRRSSSGSPNIPNGSSEDMPQILRARRSLAPPWRCRRPAPPPPASSPAPRPASAPTSRASSPGAATRHARRPPRGPPDARSPRSWPRPRRARRGHRLRRLDRRRAARRWSQQLRERGRDVEVLVNNAGYGIGGQVPGARRRDRGDDGPHELRGGRRALRRVRAADGRARARRDPQRRLGRGLPAAAVPGHLLARRRRS